MRIAYLGQMADVATENGISKKIRTQALRWIESGHQTRYFSLVPTTQLWPGLADIGAELVARGSAGRRMLRSLELARRVRAWRPDVIYFRYGYHSAGLRSLFREIPTVAEINSDDRTEYPLTLSRPKVLYHVLTRARVLRTAAGFVAVTRELAKRFAEFAKPIEVIANGITLDEFKPAPPVAGGQMRLTFVGTAGSPWHGLERVAELAQLFPHAGIDVVGCRPEDWRRVAPAGQSAPPAFTFHGALPRDRYEPLLRGATAALGSMALFKNQMEEACPLKVREYLALGLPVIAAYRDTDIADGADYFLRLPNDARPLAAERDRIAAWIERWRCQRVPRSAVAHLDSAPKETARLAFLARIGGARNG